MGLCAPRHAVLDLDTSVARLNAAAIAHLANAPTPPTGVRILVRNLDSNTALRWRASPEGDVTGYEVLWRKTTSAVWEHAKDVGGKTEAVLSVNKDSHFFGVRAYDSGGYRSPVSFAKAGVE